VLVVVVVVAGGTYTAGMTCPGSNPDGHIVPGDDTCAPLFAEGASARASDQAGTISPITALGADCVLTLLIGRLGNHCTDACDRAGIRKDLSRDPTTLASVHPPALDLIGGTDTDASSGSV